MLRVRVRVHVNAVRSQILPTIPDAKVQVWSASTYVRTRLLPTGEEVEGEVVTKS